MTDHEDTAIWVKTEPSVDGATYVVTVELGEDRSIVLTPDSTLRYASAVLEATARAEFDAAVFNQMKTKLVKDGEPDMELIGQLILDLRKDRPPLSIATAPLVLEPGVNPKGKPFLTLSIDGKPVGQWDVGPARRHALHVLEAPPAADLDAVYFRALTGLIGLDEPTARNVIEDLGKYREEFAL